MVGNTSKFKNLGHYNGHSVKFGNDGPCSMKGKGSIILNDKIIYHNIYWVDGLIYNLLSVAQLNSLGYRVEFQKKKAKNLDSFGELIESREETRGNSFYLDLHEDTYLFADAGDGRENQGQRHTQLSQTNLQEITQRKHNTETAPRRENHK